MKLSVLEKESLYQLSKLAEEHGYNVTQENGQRVFGPPDSCEYPKPNYQCEVFISKFNGYYFELYIMIILTKLVKSS